MKVAPNWFTAAMGTGIVANAAALLPRELPGVHALALAVWVAAALLLARFAAVAFEQWRRERWRRRLHEAAATARESADGAVQGSARGAGSLAMAPFWGAPPMAVLTLSAGTLLVGRDLIGERAAVAIALGLWAVGTLGGLAASVAVPVWLLRHPERRLDHVFATWLLPVVPPMVAATAGAALISHLPAGAARTALLTACWALFCASLTAVVATILLLGRRLHVHGAGPARMVPTLFIVLGPLGQSITCACLLAAAAPGAVADPMADRMATLALVYGLPVWCLTMAWLAVATVATLRTAAGPGLPFAPTWWSFIFPLGTCVTGTSGLAQRTGAEPLAWIAVALFALLLGAWLLVSAATARHARRRLATRRAAPAAA